LSQYHINSFIFSLWLKKAGGICRRLFYVFCTQCIFNRILFIKSIKTGSMYHGFYTRNKLCVPRSDAQILL